MGASNKSFPDLMGLFKTCIPRSFEPANVSRDFWMPDHSCRVCYECDSQFTLFNRRHHCRHCGRIFCAKCTSNWIPATSCDLITPQEEWQNIMVCNYCFKQWKQGLNAAVNNMVQVVNLDLSTSLSVTSFISSKSSETVKSSSITSASMPQSDGVSPRESALTETVLDRIPVGEAGTCSGDDKETIHLDHFHDGYGYDINRNSKDDDEEFGVYQFDNCSRYMPGNGYFDHAQFDEIDNECGSCKVHPDADLVDTNAVNSLALYSGFDSQASEQVQQILDKEDVHIVNDECEASSSLYAAQELEAEPVDF